MRRVSLISAAAAFALANIIHTLDHLRQGVAGLTTEILAAGSFVSLAALTTLALALRRDERAPAVAAFVGLWSAIGISASHVAPHWSAFSDPYPQIGADAISWAAVALEIGSAVLLGVIGARALRRRAVAISRA